jgi:hypothetical protein
MDDLTTKILSIVAVVVSVGGAALGIINHKRIRSTCCGHKGEVSIDVENTTPPKKEKEEVGYKPPEDVPVPPT